MQGNVLLQEAIAAGIDVREVYLRDGEPDPRGVKVVPFVLDARTFDSVNEIGRASCRERVYHPV